MYRECDFYQGIPSRMYRSAGEIRRDMRIISEKIKEANERLNLRSLLLDFIGEERMTGKENPAIWIPELEAAVEEARAAYDSLTELNEELSILREELGEVRCAMGV